MRSPSLIRNRYPFNYCVALLGTLERNEGSVLFRTFSDLNVPVYVEQYYPIVEGKGVVPAAD